MNYDERNAIKKRRAHTTGLIIFGPFAVLAFVGFFATLIIHIGSLRGISSDHIFVLFGGAVVVILPALIGMTRRFWDFMRLLKYAPVWLLPVCLVVIIYAGITIGISPGIRSLNDASPTMKNDRYYQQIDNGGRREITKETYDLLQARVTRVLTGFMMPFYIVSGTLLIVRIGMMTEGEKVGPEDMIRRYPT